MNCIRCNKTLVRQNGFVYDAVIFTSPGNYGSKVYDPMNDQEGLMIYLCDTCLLDRQSVVLKQTETTSTTVTHAPWEGLEDHDD